MQYYAEQLPKLQEAVQNREGKKVLDIYKDHKIRSKDGAVHDPVGDYVRDTVFGGMGNSLTLSDRMEMARINRKKVREMTPEQRAEWNKEHTLLGRTMTKFKKGRDKVKQKAQELALAGSMRMVGDRGTAKPPVNVEYTLKKKASYSVMLGRHFNPYL